MNDDVETFYDLFERLSLIYISRPHKPVIITGNIFQNNIGTFGGSISINSPNWEQNKTAQIVMRSNSFSNNMAYFSGNAVYIRSTLKKVSILNQNCGGGVDIEDNIFTNNIGLKIHNGGALSVQCFYVIDKLADDFYATSGQPVNNSTVFTLTDRV